ncbi:hypothetical protein FF36_02522, partial [Frankia torreyi]
MRGRLLGQARARLQRLMRASFEQKSPFGMSDPAQAGADRAVDLLRETLHTGDPTALNTAIDLFHQAVAATPTDDPDRAGMLS